MKNPVNPGCSCLLLCDLLKESKKLWPTMTGYNNMPYLKSLVNLFIVDPSIRYTGKQCKHNAKGR